SRQHVSVVLVPSPPASPSSGDRSTSRDFDGVLVVLVDSTFPEPRQCQHILAIDSSNQKNWFPFARYEQDLKSKVADGVVAREIEDVVGRRYQKELEIPPRHFVPNMAETSRIFG